VGYLSFPRKRESRGSKISAAAPCSSQGQALDPRFRGGDDTLVITLASFQVRLLVKLASKLYGRSILLTKEFRGILIH
jgi:hypothetical protein